jgi:uncharacterized repeat protein (TIGR03803 family)
MIRLSVFSLALCIGAAACSQPGTSLPSSPANVSRAGSAASSDGSPRYKLLYSFMKSSGAKPQAGLTPVGTLFYGTTREGGAHDLGTIFELTRSGRERALYSLKGGDDGASPRGLVAAYGALYGIAEYGGTENNGAIFKFDPSSGKFEVIYRFKGGTQDGYRPVSALIAANRMLYGTTARGGSDGCRETHAVGCGTVFEVSQSGKERVLYRFAGNRDGQLPLAGLRLHEGELFGTTRYGGSTFCKSGCGTVYAVSLNGKERVVHAFDGGSGGHEDGAFPEAPLVAFSGLLYGTTDNGGGSDNCTDGCGTVFEVSAGGKERILHKFEGHDGAFLCAPLLVEGGTFYGTAAGGASHGDGNVFELELSGKFRELYEFKGSPDGDYPVAPLAAGKGAAARRPFYGTTMSGGMEGCHRGCGTIFSISP